MKFPLTVSVSRGLDSPKSQINLLVVSESNFNVVCTA